MKVIKTEIIGGSIMNINELLFKAINGLAHQSILLDNVMIILSKYVPDIFMAALVVFYILGVFNKNEKIRGITVDTFVITVINLALSFIIGIFYYVPRPFVQQKVNLLFTHIIDASFPSDHAIGTMSIAIGINLEMHKKNFKEELDIFLSNSFCIL
jgi:undecaprenyl-diphosphatase